MNVGDFDGMGAVKSDDLDSSLVINKNALGCTELKRSSTVQISTVSDFDRVRFRR